MRSLISVACVFWMVGVGVGCGNGVGLDTPMSPVDLDENTHEAAWLGDERPDVEVLDGTWGQSGMCNGGTISSRAAERVLALTQLTNNEDVYTTYNRIDRIASFFEACGDPWGMFPTAYRHITRRIIQALERQEIEDVAWGRAIVLDFASRYFENLRAALLGQTPSYAWNHYYNLADDPDASRTRAVVVAMVAHLTLDLPYAMVAIDTVESQRDDFFELGDLMIEITPDFIAELDRHYDADTEDILNGFFFGDWVDGAFGPNTTITLSYQTIRTKSWNNRWYLEQSWGEWIAEGEIYAAFWNIDGVLATLDAAGTI